MILTTFTAFAASCSVIPGATQSTDDGRLLIRAQRFTDEVDSQDPRVAGTNTPVLDLDLDAESGAGELHGTFHLQPRTIAGAWEGALGGSVADGRVTSWGIARGTGTLDGLVMRIDFEQLAEYPGEPPCASPLAFFQVRGVILERP